MDIFEKQVSGRSATTRFFFFFFFIKIVYFRAFRFDLYMYKKGEKSRLLIFCPLKGLRGPLKSRVNLMTPSPSTVKFFRFLKFFSRNLL